MFDARAANRISLQELDQRGGLARQLLQRFARAVAQRGRAGDALRGQMLHQPEKERQVAGLTRFS